MWLVGCADGQLNGHSDFQQTVDRTNSKIRGPTDLAGKKMRTVHGTVAGRLAYRARGCLYLDVANRGEDRSHLQGESRLMSFELAERFSTGGREARNCVLPAESLVPIFLISQS